MSARSRGQKRNRPQPQSTKLPDLEAAKADSQNQIDETPPAPEEKSIKDAEGFYHIPVSTLPSKGLVYRDLDNVPMKIWNVDDVEAISSVGDDPDRLDAAIYSAMQNCIDIEAGDLTPGDMMYLMVWQRVNAYGHEYPIRMYCDETEDTIRTVYDLRTLHPIKINDKLWLKHMENNMELKLGNHTVRIDILRRRHFDEALAHIRRTRQQGVTETLAQYAATLIEIDGDKADMSHAVKFLRGLTPAVYARIGAFQDTFYHGLDLSVGNDTVTIEHPCPNWKPDCGCELCDEKEGRGMRNLRLPFRLDLFIPPHRTYIDLESEIQNYAGESRGD